MIRVIPARKRNIPFLIEYKLKTIFPYVNDSREKLKVINYVNSFMKDNYQYAYLIKNNFKTIGGYLIKDKELDLLYIESEYQNKGIGSKVLNKIIKDINIIKVRKDNKKAREFYSKWGFKVKEVNKDIVILEKRDCFDN